MTEMNRYAESLRVAYQGRSTVLIMGPTGSGKTTLAKKIHSGSTQRGGPFVTVNLASCHEGTLESELFGHEKGAFTGAERKRIGKLESADGGTVFLDEVGELTPRLQSRLLEFLQSKTVCPLGGQVSRRLNVRVIAATHRDLERAVMEGRFREDLFHRIRVVQIKLKSIVELSDSFGDVIHGCLEDVSRALNRRVLRLSEDVARILEKYHWPGNYRELKNVFEYAVLACDGVEIKERDLPQWFLEAQEKGFDSETGLKAQLGTVNFPMSLNFAETHARFEQEYLRKALERFGGGVNRTAKGIGMNKATFLRRISFYQINPRAYGLMLGSEPIDQ